MKTIEKKFKASEVKKIKMTWLLSLNRLKNKNLSSIKIYQVKLVNF